MRYFLLLLLISVTVHLSVAPPVNQKTKEGENEVEEVEEMADMEYRRYLMEVVQALESDPDFKAKLEKADEADIRTGKIADQLEFVNHNVRSKLDEIKREELERLRHLATKENELKNGLDLKMPEHLDHTNTRTFEIQDLKKLIAKTTKDLARADKKRREQFKQHEMERKYEEQEKLKHMNDVDRQKYEQELQAMKEKHKQHEPVHHPGSKQQLEEVWEKKDHMESEDFNPRTFFYFHDLDGNGVWDQDEVKTLFLQELDKLYAQGAPQDELLKRVEEMERMREHVFNEADLDKDGLISYEEFLEQTKKPDFQRDEGWQPLDEQQIYTQEEYEAFQRQKQQNLIAKGIFPRQAAPVEVNPNVQHPQQYQNIQYQQQQPVVHQQLHDQIQQQQQQFHLNLQQQQQQQQQYQQQQQQQYQQQQHQQQQYQQQQQQVPVQQMHGGVPPQQQYQGQQQQQAQEQHQAQQVHPQATNFQQPNAANEVQRNAEVNAQQKSNPSQLNVQDAQFQAQQDNRNSIPTNEKKV